MTVMAILQEVDKCIRCNGCVVGCKRTYGMEAGPPGHRVNEYSRVVIKSQKKTDMGPFIRFSCWHCENPPCVGRCPYKAITKDAEGGVNVNKSLCTPNVGDCKLQCVSDCQRGGYPKIGTGNGVDNIANKCTLCAGRAGLNGDLPSKADKNVSGAYISSVTGAAVPELAHQPACVYTCPAKAMTYDTRANIIAKLTAMQTAANTAGTPFSHVGDGSMFWVSTKYTLVPPKADPFIEDHITPMVSGALSSPLVKAAIVPTLVVGGLMALSARRAENEKEELAVEGEVAR